MKTPDDWRHARLDETTKGKFSVRTFYCHGRFGPLALMALGLDAKTRTEGLAAGRALALGTEIEAALVKMNSDLPRKRAKAGQAVGQ